MLFKVGDQIVDTETTPVALIFKTKEEGKIVGNIISNIIDGDTSMTEEQLKGNGNWWMMFPAGVSKEDKDKWSTLSDAEKELLESRGGVTGKLDFQL